MKILLSSFIPLLFKYQNIKQNKKIIERIHRSSNIYTMQNLSEF